MIAEASRLYGSMVIARDTALTYKGRDVDPRTVAAELGVRWVVRGSVRYAGERVRLDLALIDGETGVQRSTDRFESDRAELRRLLDEFVQTLARLLVNEVYASAAARAARLTPDQVTADDLAMQGIALWLRGITRENALAAIDFFDRAVAIDPKNLGGWAGVGYARLHADLNGWLPDRDAARKRISEAGARIEEIDPDSHYGFQARVIRAAPARARSCVRRARSRACTSQPWRQPSRCRHASWTRWKTIAGKNCPMPPSHARWRRRCAGR